MRTKPKSLTANTLATVGLSALLGGCWEVIGSQEPNAPLSTMTDVTSGDTTSGDTTSGDTTSADASAPVPDTGTPDPVQVERGDDEGDESVTMLVVVDQLLFPRVSEDGLSAPGFNLDGRISGVDDVKSCGQKDLTSPTGEKGIDNQLATLIPVMEFVGLGAFETLVQRSIEEGGLLLMLEFGGIDDLINDPEVTMTIRLGAGTPLLGTNGLLLAGQTFDPHLESPDALSPARIEDGVIMANDFQTRIPIVVFGVLYELTIKNAQFRAAITADGGLEAGLLGGGVPMSDLIAIAQKANNNDDSILAAVQTVVGGAADLDRDGDGECRLLSTAIEITAVAAYLQ